MNRIYKFRAWDVEKKEMVYRFFAIDNTNGRCYKCENSMNDLLYELMQFTGLTDKLGKDIYEGDIVKTKAGNGEVFYTHIASFQIKLKDESTMPMGEWYQKEQDFEVIGNIYENKELLK